MKVKYLKIYIEKYILIYILIDFKNYGIIRNSEVIRIGI